MKNAVLFILLFMSMFLSTEVVGQRYIKQLISVDSTMVGNGTQQSPLGIDSNIVALKTDIPLPEYKIYVAKITQSGTSAPSAYVLRNTFNSEPVWAYGGTGFYTVTIPGELEVLSYVVFATLGNTTSGFIAVDYNDAENSLWVNTRNASNAQANGILNASHFMIISYQDYLNSQ